MSSPLVSIIMSVHNGSSFLHEAIDSMLSQTFQNFEFIIIDDGSTDSTFSLVDGYRNLDDRILVIRFEKNQGLSTCLNVGIELARGKYIARMDADDISLPHRLERQVSFLESHPEIDVLGSCFTIIDETGKRIKDYVFPKDPGIILWNFIFYNPIAHSSAIMRSATIKELGGYDQRLLRSQDYEMWWHVSLNGRIANLQEICLLLRQHGDSVSVKYRAQQHDFSRGIKQKYLGIILDREISAEILDNLMGKRTTALSAVLTGNVILDYCEYCIRRSSPKVHLTILVQALKKTLLKIMWFAFHPVVLNIWRRIFLLVVQIIIALKKQFLIYIKRSGNSCQEDE